MRRVGLLRLAGSMAATGLLAAAVVLTVLLREPPPPAAMPATWAPVVDTMAGDGTPGATDGPFWAARFSDPFGLIATDDGVVVADGVTNTLRLVTRDGLVATLAGVGEGFVDGTRRAASFHTPSGLARDVAGTLYVADAGNHAVRRVRADGLVDTLAGTGQPGDADGPSARAQFNGPLGVAVAPDGRVLVADTYNDRVRVVGPDGRVRTLAGGSGPGLRDGRGTDALFDTPSGIAVGADGTVFVADTGNDAIRRITAAGVVSTLARVITHQDGREASLWRPVGVAVTHDGFLLVTDRGGRIVQMAPDGRARVLAGDGPGSSDGPGRLARFTTPAGIGADDSGTVYVADAGNGLVRRLRSPVEAPRGWLAYLSDGGPLGRPVTRAVPASSDRGLPRLSAETLGLGRLLWPLDPQDGWHEVTGTVGEARGSAGGAGHERFHAGLDIRGDHGAPVRAVRDEKVLAPLAASGVGTINESFVAGAFTYVHLRVGRDRRDRPIDDVRFLVETGEDGRPVRVRVRRGTRLRTGDALGTVNRFQHVHLQVGPVGGQLNPLLLPLVAFSDTVPPTIVAGGIRLFDEAWQPLDERRQGRIVVRGRVHIVADAYDQVDGNLARRRLGLFATGYAIRRADGTPVSGFEQPRMTLRFDRLPPDDRAPLRAYADGSGIPAYGNRRTRFLYVVTSTVVDGRVVPVPWDSSSVPPGDYVLSVVGEDARGNRAARNTDVPIVVVTDAP